MLLLSLHSNLITPASTSLISQYLHLSGSLAHFFLNFFSLPPYHRWPVCPISTEAEQLDHQMETIWKPKRENRNEELKNIELSGGPNGI